MNANERRELLRRITSAERVVHGPSYGPGSRMWAQAYADGVRALLAALETRDALLLRWLDTANDDAGWCELCTGCEDLGHASNCPVPATRTLLAQLEDD